MPLDPHAGAIACGLMLGLLCATAAAPLQAAGRQARAATTPGELADQVSEVRVFLTDRADEVIGELVVAGDTRLEELVVPMEKQQVRFADDGIAPDRRRGDRIFTARYHLDIQATFKLERAALASSSDALTGDGRAWVRRGPRDTVPANAAWQSIRAAGLPGFDNLPERTRRVLSAKDAHEAARLLGVDYRSTPFMVWPTARFLSPRRLFGVSFLTGLPAPPPPIRP